MNCLVVVLILSTINILCTGSEEKAGNLTAEGVGQFLKEIKLEKFVELFIENGIDGETLIAFDDKDLEDMGIEKKYERTKILKKFKNYLQKI